MTVYTKNGDEGKTYLFGGKKVWKSEAIIEAIGTIDELNAFISFLNSKLKNKKNKNFLVEIQKDLYQIMSILSGGEKEDDFLDKKTLIFEKKIDELEKNLPPLNKFIIPGTTEISSLFHITRTICRRAERKIVKLKKHQKIIKYLNRLSDLFFVFARFYSKKKEITLK